MRFFNDPSGVTHWLDDVEMIDQAVAEGWIELSAEQAIRSMPARREPHMRYFKDIAGQVHGYDETDESQILLIDHAVVEGWIEVTGAWPPLPSVVEIRNTRWELIKVERDRRIQSGGYKVGTKWFHSDTFSRTQQMGLVMLGVNIPANTPWKTMDGSFITMTPALAGQIFAAAAASDIAIFAAAETHKTAMQASSSPADYDFSAGWPAIYGE